MVRDGTARQEIIRVLHLTHIVNDTMMLQSDNRLFWPRIRAELDGHYTE